MARELIANITIGNDFYGPDYEPIPDKLAHLVTNPNVWSDATPDSVPDPSTSPLDGSGTTPELHTKTVSELKSIADGLGVDVPSRARKADIVDAITQSS